MMKQSQRVREAGDRGPHCGRMVLLPGCFIPPDRGACPCLAP